MFIPFANMATQVAGPPINPVTSGLVFEMGFGPGQSYSGTGTTITDLSTYAEAGVVSGATYNSNRYFTFTNSVTSNIKFVTNTPYTQLGFVDEWTIFAYVKLNNTTNSVYIAEKSNTNDRLSLVGNYDAGAVRPWNGNYRGMPALSIGTTLASVAFTKGANGVANNYKSYKDGSNVATISSDFTLALNTNGAVFNNFDPGDFDLYNFMYYDRALSASEVTSLHNYVTSY